MLALVQMWGIGHAERGRRTSIFAPKDVCIGVDPGGRGHPAAGNMDLSIYTPETVLKMYDAVRMYVHF
jgi:hypothetical protein